MNIDLSVIVPAVNTLLDAVECLQALERQRDDVNLEVLVIVRTGPEVAGAIPRLFSWARVIPVPLSTTIPEMRARGFRESTGTAIAVIEDHVIVPPGWARRMIAALAQGQRVVGGSVENAATETLIDWACFLCEYSHCLTPLESGSVGWLTGNNVVYTRDVIDSHRDVVEAGRWENYLHDTLRQEGVELHCRPEIVVGHKKHYTFGEYLSQRYLYARSYAGARVAGAPLTKRAAYGVAALALPPILLLRTVTRITKKRKHVGLMVKSIPMIAVFVTAWGAGEVVGYLFGPGDSLARVC